MADQTRPLSPDQAPDPSDSYERSRPEKQPGMGRLDNNEATPANDPDRTGDAVGNKQDPRRQINAHDAVNARGGTAPEEDDRPMSDDEPRGEDLTPTDIHDPKMQRHPRREGKGGVP
jgi:hypothetical protein